MSETYGNVTVTPMQDLKVCHCVVCGERVTVSPAPKPDIYQATCRNGHTAVGVLYVLPDEKPQIKSNGRREFL